MQSWVSKTKKERNRLLQKPETHQWNSSLVQKWNSSKVLMTQERYRVLENIDTGVSYDCAIKITESNGRFEATAVRLTPVLVEQAAALETETEPVNRSSRK